MASEGQAAAEAQKPGPKLRPKPQALDLEMIHQEAGDEGLLTETGSMQVEGFQISEGGIKRSPLHDTSPLAHSMLPLQVPVETSKPNVPAESESACPEGCQIAYLT